jgi:DNA-directed RNA polymerase alpha subunit
LLSGLRLPNLEGVKEPEIMNDPIDTLRKSATYPYGLSEWMLEELHAAGIHSVQELYEAPEDKLDEIKYVGESRIRQMKNVVSQAIWL